MPYDCWELSTEHYRDVIEGKIHFRKCPSCNGNGYDYYDTTTGEIVDRYNDDILHSLKSEFSLSTDSCEICKGLGYIQSYSD